LSEASIPDWISSIAAAIGALAVVIGLFRADKKVSEVLRNARLLKRSEIAEELIAIALNVEDAMKDIRNPFDSIPKEKAQDRLYGYQRRYERLAKYNELFQRLREAQIRERALIGDSEVSRSVDVLFDARSEVAVAIEMLADLSQEIDSRPSQEERDQRVRMRRTLYGSFSDADELGSKVSGAVNEIEERLRPYARLEDTKTP